MLARVHGLHVILSEDLLPTHQRPLIQRLRRHHVPLGELEGPQVVDHPQGGEMLGAHCGLVADDGALVQSTGIIHVSRESQARR